MVFTLGAVRLAFAVLFIASPGALAGASSIDLDHDGIADEADVEVTVTTNESLPAGEHTFTNLTIATGVTLTLMGNGAAGAEYRGVSLTADRIIIESGATLDATNQGYADPSSPGADVFPGGYGGGYGHGGKGGAWGYSGESSIGGLPYDSAMKPVLPGNGPDPIRSRGGGAIRINAGALTIDGAIRADGGRDRGSGGSIWIDTDTLGGGGSITASGAVYYPYWPYSGGGGGGRIAVYYRESNFTGDVNVDGGIGFYGADGDAGTAVFVDVTRKELHVRDPFRFEIGDEPFVFDSIVFSDGARVAAHDGVSIATDSFVMRGDAVYAASPGQRFRASEVTLEDSSRMLLADMEAFEAEALHVRNTASLELPEGTAVTFEIPTITVAPHATINGTNKGLGDVNGPGSDGRTGGAGGGYGHGGRGGSWSYDSESSEGGGTYDSETAPVMPGNGPDPRQSRGGGALHIITDTLTLDGAITVNGGLDRGSGGSVFIEAETFEGSGAVTANGADHFGYWPYSGGGGGGRIAVYHGVSTFSGTFEANGGQGWYGRDGEDGTIVYTARTGTSSLAYVPGSGYGDDAVSPGVHPNKGVANSDALTFKVAYAGGPADELLLSVSERIGFASPYFTSAEYVPEEAASRLTRAQVGADPEETQLGYDDGALDPNGFDAGESLTFSPGGHPKREVSVDILVRRLSGGLGDEYLTVLLEAFDDAGTVVGRAEQTVDVSDIDDSATVPASLSVVSTNDDITGVRFAVTDASFSIKEDAEAWIRHFTFGERLPMAADSSSGGGSVHQVSSTFPKGEYAYHFEVVRGGERVARLPEGEEDLPFVTGHNSVAFIPGLEASRLYKPGLTSATEDQLWYPNSANDIRNLALSPTTGESLDSDVYTRDVLDEVVGTVNIYKTFLARMRALVDTDVIARFEPFPYDWRMDQQAVARGYVAMGQNGEGYTMKQTIRDMAATSDSGRVTIITHSNGGLVAKELIEALRADGDASLVDHLIMVAAPELGTPSAILALLHGDDLPGVPTHANTRELGENMQSAYALLPSRGYFAPGAFDQLPSDHVIEFSTTTSVTKQFRDVYGNTITDYDSLHRFVLGEQGVRSEPAPTAVHEPNVLKAHFLERAEALHAFQDTWEPPEGVRVTEIVGWGLDTLNGIRYEAARVTVCAADGSACTKREVIDPRPVVAQNGDGTVIHTSGEATRGGTRYWVEMHEYNQENLVDRDHKNILEVESLLELLSMLVRSEPDPSLPDFIRSTQPSLASAGARLRIGVHSPVTLHLYDANGNHTGPSNHPDPESDLPYVEEEIPNTYYWQIGEGQYAGMGTEEAGYVELQGEALGSFTLTIDEVNEGETVVRHAFVDIPTTEKTIVRVPVRAEDTQDPVLHVDIDGDGNEELMMRPNRSLSDAEFYTMLRGIVRTLGLSPEREKQLLRAIDFLASASGALPACEIKKSKMKKNVPSCIQQYAPKIETRTDRLVAKIELLTKQGYVSRVDMNTLISLLKTIQGR